jgi:hypothetical protein
MVDVLYARAEVHKAGFFGMFSAGRAVHRTEQAAADAAGNLDLAIHQAWVDFAGIDIRDNAAVYKALQFGVEDRE